MPVSTFQHSCLSLDAIVPLPAVSEAQDWLDDDLSVLLYDHQVPLEMRTIFVSIRSWYHAGKPPVSYLEVYTDGSASSQSHDGRPRAWAVTVWAVSGQERLLVGCAAAPAAPEGTPHHLGENQQCALTGELLALCWSLAWTCEFARSYHVPVWHLYDAKGAGEGVFGCCKAPLALHHEPSPFARLYTLATSLRQVASSRVALHHGYVAGHSGTLGNELADQFAKRARREADDPWNRCLPMWPAQLARHPLLLWAWALHPAVPDVPSLYAFETEALRLQALDLPPTQAPMQGLVRSSLSDGDVHFHLTLVTFNVLTLLERSLTRRAETCVPEDQSRPVGMRIFGRKAVLKSSLEEVSPHIVGLQETRLPEASTRIDDEYHIFTSPANEKGSGGCALWLSKHRPYAQQEGVELKFSRDQVTVVSASSRHLAASILTPRLHLFVIVAHAPSFPSVSYEVLQTFWQERTREAAKRPEGCQLVVLADANARLGCTASEYVGDHHGEQELVAGHLFHLFLAQNDIFAPSTFSEYHQGPSGTWRPLRGSGTVSITFWCLESGQLSACTPRSCATSRRSSCATTIDLPC